ncbi:ABC transporter permease [Streptomyces tsukubensis]|nr:ABC transporter permease [Streptomyces tsukubensis]QFR97866.1 ABC transporter permease [Streptomyces tsukubensis]
MLLRLALRRDRLLIPVWTVAISGVLASMPNSLAAVYGTAAERANMAATATATSSLRAVYGPVFSDSTGGLAAWRAGLYAAAFAAVMSLIVVVRHTREEEETGRQELLSSACVARGAPLTAALLAALAGNTAIAVLVTAGLSGQGYGGALALGLAVGCTGMFFAAAAAVAAQLTESARLAKGLTAAALGAAFVLRAAGDSARPDGSSPLTWISPLGWAEQVRSYADERWWALLLPLAGALLLTALAYRLTGRRDLTMSFLPSRPGPATGAIRSAGALALRLQRGALVGWGAGFLVLGAVFGWIAGSASDLVGGSRQAREVFQRMGGQSGLTDAFLAAMVGLLGMAAALYGVASVLRLHGEETSQRAEPLLAARLGRLRWAAGHLALAYGGAALIMVLGGAGLALGHGHDMPAVLGACLGQLPAIWALTSVAVLLYGALPRTAPAAWAVAGVCLALGWVGPALDLPRAVMDVSPFSHLAKLPGGAMEWPPAVILTAVATALTVAGLAGLRRRDLVMT